MNYITPWFDGNFPLKKRFEGIEWYDRKTSKYIKCSMPWLELMDRDKILRVK